MTSYKGLLNKIEAFCNAHLQIKKYGGEFKEQMPNFSTENEKYPIVYVVPSGDLSDLNTNQFTLDVYCVDIIQKDRANINTIVSDCNLIVNDLYLYFLDGNDLTVDVIGASNGSPLNNFDLDYSAGWVKTITFEVQSYSVCAIPMNPISPNPPVVCDDATVRNSDSTYLQTVASGSTLTLPDINITDSDGSIFTYPSVQDVTCTPAPPCDDAVQIIEDSEGNELYNNSIPSGATETQVIQDSTYLVEYVNGTLIESGSILAEGSVTIQVPNPVTCEDVTVNVNGAFWDSVPSGGTENVIVRQSSGSTQVGSIQGQYFRIADSTAVLKTTGGTTISTTSIKAEASANIVAPNTTIEVNGTTEGTVVAGATVDIQLSNPSGTVTPTSITQVGNDLQVVLPATATPRSTATLLKTGQTTSYRTGDDGDIEAGRDVSFLILAENNPFGNTNRFTDELGGQTYTNNIVIDWSTYNGSKVLGYYRRLLNTGGVTYDFSWNDAIDKALTHSVTGFTSGWRLWNRRELDNIINLEYSNGFPPPFDNASGGQIEAQNLWTSSTLKISTTQAWYTQFYGSLNYGAKSGNRRIVAVRDFTVTGTTLS